MNSVDNKYFFYPDKKKRATMNLLCFPYAGAGASIFLDWVSAFPDEIQLIFVQLPGREARISEPPYENINSLVDDIVSCMDNLLDKPFAFFGHSMGALIAYCVTKHLVALGKSVPQLLIASGRQAPDVDEVFTSKGIRSLSDKAFIDLLRHYQATPIEVLDNANLIKLIAPRIRSDFLLLESFSFVDKASICCPILALHGKRDHIIHREESKAWSKHTSNDFTLLELDDDHFFMNTSKNAVVSAIIEHLFKVNKESQVVNYEF